MHRVPLAGTLALASAPVLPTSGQPPEPDAAARNAILARMKDAAVNYADRLPVTTAESTMIMAADADRVHMRHHGLVYADCETAMPMWLQIEAEPASVVQKLSKIALGYEIDVRYIGGRGFVLPQTAEETVRFGASQTKVEMQFQQYRKYDSSATVRFDTDGKR